MTFAFDVFESTFPKIGANFSFDLTGGSDGTEEEVDEATADSGEGERRGALRKARSEKPNSGAMIWVSFPRLLSKKSGRTRLSF